jgi:hypothetical protein
MALSINFSEEKNQLLKATRGVCFEDVVIAIKDKQILDNIGNPNFNRAHQKIFVVKINHYVYAVPYVINEQKKEMYLKTIYPSRKLTKQYLGRKK